MSDVIVRDAPPRVSLIAKIADRYGVEPERMLGTLKATAFKTSNGVTNEQMMALLIVADQYRLNPFTREIYAYPDKGGIVAVVGYDGWVRIVNEHPAFDGVGFEFNDGKDECTCTIWRKDRSHPIVITEYLGESKRNTEPWNKQPKRMLRNRSLTQCARLAFGFAGIYDPDEAERVLAGSMERIEPASASADRVREVLHAEQVIDAEPLTPPPPDPEAPALPSMLLQYVALVSRATDRESAELVLSEAMDVLDPDQLDELASAFRARFPQE
jgi:hypothetical protein